MIYALFAPPRRFSPSLYCKELLLDQKNALAHHYWDVGALRHVLLHLFVFVFVVQLVVHCAVNCCSTTVSPLIRKPRIHVLWFRLSKRLPVHLGEGVSLVGRCRHRRNPPSENGDLESAENGDLRTERRRVGTSDRPSFVLRSFKPLSELSLPRSAASAGPSTVRNPQ